MTRVRIVITNLYPDLSDCASYHRSFDRHFNGDLQKRFLLISRGKFDPAQEIKKIKAKSSEAGLDTLFWVTPTPGDTIVLFGFLMTQQDFLVEVKEPDEVADPYFINKEKGSNKVTICELATHPHQVEFLSL